MVDEVSNKTLAVLLIVAIAISLGGTLVSLNRLAVLRLGGGGITGYASASGTGTTNISISSSASIKFAINTLDFGPGAVNNSGSNTICSLASGKGGGSKDTSARCINFTAAASLESLQIENDGTVNLTVNLTSDHAAAAFIGGPSGLQLFRLSCANNETNACASPVPGGWATINSSGQMVLCGSAGGLGFITTANSLTLNINVTVPYDSYFAGQGNQIVTLTAIGTSVP
jgi:hypothetical protein